MIFTGLCVLAGFMLWHYGLIRLMLASDRTYISVIICVLYIASSLHCLWRTLAIAREGDAGRGAALILVKPDAVFSAAAGRKARYDSRGADETELLQGRYSVVKTDFLEDLSILEFQYGRAGEFHLAAGVGRQRSRQEVAERLPGMRSAAFPSTDDIVAFRDEIRSTPEVEIGECFPKVRHERSDVLTATAWFVERILQEHVWRSEFIDDCEVAGLAPKIREPSANDDLVVFFL
jgi:hypothetical protein